ncbi:NDR1/HIN1-like protein 6 [Cicer arietinum]|uniref:NDR1/HIN1-like protein 6 n=1 Tax=Cicer arietinum TaxID=3827 RepID=A0A1S2XCV4_CICAR|nr:NDR1/HIN1-like protein 6 [Cicer arietinum]
MVIVLYFFLEPKIPIYNVENLDVKNFDLRKDDKLHSDIDVFVKAENPNQEIGLDYLENEVSIIYSGSIICKGKFPIFLQPVKNITNFNVTLKGDSDFGPEMQSRLIIEQKLGHIPLLVVVKLPIRLVISDFFHLRKFVVNVNCSLVIDQLQHNKRPKILKKEFTYDVHL